VSWYTLFVAVAGAAAALSGLLFVAFSLNLSSITTNPMHMGRSRETLATLVILLIMSIFVLIPVQPRQLLGVELLLGGLWVLVRSGRSQLRTLSLLAEDQRLAWGRRNLLLNGATLCILISGLSLLVGRFGGLYWLVPTIAVYFPWAIINAWVLVVRVGGESRA
jgi:modulator of FtsH protease